MQTGHRDVTIDQFTRQAAAFARSAAHSLNMEELVELSGASGTERMLDVACGPGLTARAFAPQVAEFVGVDLTAEMIRRAREATAGLGNVRFVEAGVEALPFPEAAFDLVFCRYAVHHFEDPAAAIAEMARVCRPGGRVMVVDMEVDADRADAFNAWERLRDPSHQRALTRQEMVRHFTDHGLRLDRLETYGVPVALDAQLADSAPAPEDAIRFRNELIAGIGVNRLGVDARDEEGGPAYTYPIAVYLSRR